MRWPLRNDRPVDGSRPLHDRYVVGEPIGQGRSTVYRGTDTRLGRSVAIKRVPLVSDHESGERVRVRALREARAAAKLDNPAVVTVYDVVEEDGALWLVMELVDSPSLAQLVVDGGPLDHTRAARIGLDILSAIDTAHRVGVIHRDVKPANVLVPSGGHAKLADFGVATMRDESRLTATGMVLGSPAYMAPEQARGEEIGPPADLWALGATLYFMYEGVPPFDGGTALATASAVVHGEPRAETRSGALTPLVARLLSKPPGDRPDADEVKAELRAVARSEDEARPPRTAPTVVVPAAAPAPGPPTPEPKAQAEPEPKTEAEPKTEPEPTPESEPTPEPKTEAEAEAEADRDEPEMPETLSATTGLTDDALAEDLAMLAASPASHDRDSHEPTKVVPAPVVSEAPPAAAPKQRQVSGSMIAALVAAAVLVAVAFMVLRPDGDSGSPRDDEAEQAQTTTTAEPSAAAEEAPEETTTAPTTTAPPTTTTEPAVDTAQLPDGWQTYTNDQAGYTIGYPSGWEIRQAGGPRIDIRDPESGSYLRVDWTDQPRGDPVADWETQSQSFAASHQAYEEISIAPYTYRDYLAAGWEFRYTDGGARLHTMNLGFVTGGKGYALYFQTKEERWDASQDLFAQFRNSFQPAP